MFVKITSGAVMGVNGYIVDVEVDVASGLPSFDVVGLPDSAVKESRERVRAAIRNADFTFPIKRITVNLAPADTRKSGPAFDLPIAVGLLICSGALNETFAENTFFAGELSLDGAIRPITGVLPMLLAARDAGITACYIPAENAREASLVTGMTVYPLEHILQLQPGTAPPGDGVIPPITDAPHGVSVVPPSSIAPFVPTKTQSIVSDYDVDFADVSGQAHVKRALEIAAAGCHNLVMIGPPGAGKTMLARRMPTILPDLSFEESIEITKIYSIAGLLGSRHLITQRPFRTPHHTASYVSLTGGGRVPMPGEISLSHNGVLFLDELPEFQKKALETLRQPLEDGQITLNRAGGVCTYPSVFLLLAAMNPCPCGYAGTEKCKCTDAETARYLDKISGPLLDRIDIMVEATPVSYGELTNTNRTTTETSAAIKARVENARTRQQHRFADTPVRFNAKMTASQVKKYCPLNKESNELLKQVFESMNMSARAYHKILKIARTIADLTNSPEIKAEHIAEAISYRGLDRKYW
jgi:magnesium chelatase family protein